MTADIPGPCLRTLQRMAANYGLAATEDLYCDPEVFSYCSNHGYIRVGAPGTYCLTEKASCLLAEHSLRHRDEVAALVLKSAALEKRRVRARASSSVRKSPRLGTTDHGRCRICTSAGWFDARGAALLGAVDRLTAKKGCWLPGWQCFGDDPLTNQRLDKLLKGECPEITTHIQASRKGYRWVDEAATAKCRQVPV